MPFLVDVQQRQCQPEVMDQPDLDEIAHHRALRGLARLNWWSGSAGVLWPALREMALTHSGRTLRVLDVATGGGDLPLALWKKAQKHRLPIEFTGCDVSPQAVRFAAARAHERGASVAFLRMDALSESLPTDYDVLTCSLFLHHLSDEQAVGLLRRMAQAARSLVLVNDLVRTRFTYGIVYAASRLLTWSPVVRIDALLSVRAAFTMEEAATLSRRAGLEGAVIRSRFPARFLLTWRRPAAKESVP